MSNEEITYLVSKKVLEGEITKSEGINQLYSKINMNKGSASIIIGQVYPKLFNGVLFKRTVSVAYFSCFLECIKRDYGNKQLSISLSGLKKHIDYILTTGDSKITLRKIYGKYLELSRIQLTNNQQDEIEQTEIIDLFKEKSKNDLKAELDNLPELETEEVYVNQKKYKRDNKAIALIKLLRNNECQICGKHIKKKDGTKYIEAAHIKAKSEGGNETLENILLLCPNHHKEFDLGDLKILNHSNETIKFTLNKSNYEISLLISE
ncbi:HNH endonuclease [Winogradskyella sp.]|uniref:HNH endonuclease n=1 Tax=Winogradskyella sp. TaxID=1883156 RepID=UPI0025E330D6|nr:HNH endonuclease [Winogradskyella sp.]